MINQEMNNQIGSLLESLNQLEKGFREMSLDEQQEFLIFLSRVIKLTKGRVKRKTLIKLKDSLEAVMLKCFDEWMQGEMVSEAIN